MPKATCASAPAGDDIDTQPTGLDSARSLRPSKDGKRRYGRRKPGLSPAPPRRSAAWRAGSACGSGIRMAARARLVLRRDSVSRSRLSSGCAGSAAIKQRLRIRVQRMRAELGGLGDLDELTEIHHRDAVTDMRHGGEIVADEQVADAKRRLQMLQLVHDLRADRHVERRDRLVQHDQPRVGHQRTGDGDALALAAAEFVREELCHVGLQADQLQHLGHALVPLLRVTCRCGSPAARR